MSNIDIFLDTNSDLFIIKGLYRQQYNDDNQIEIILNEVFCKNNLNISHKIILELKKSVKIIIEEYTKDLNFYGNITGNLLDYLTDNELLDNFYYLLKKECYNEK
jgi:hypothetical protein